MLPAPCGPSRVLALDPDALHRHAASPAFIMDSMLASAGAEI
jgi:hypothetical protein